jgi:hypothetical protein
VTAPVHITTKSLPRRERIAHWGRQLRGWRGYVLFGCAFLPGVVAEILWPGTGFALGMLGVCVALVALVLGVSLLVTLVTSIPTRTLVFASETVSEELRGKRTEHGWDWVTAAAKTDDLIVLTFRPPPPRSLRLAPIQLTELSVREKAVGAPAFALLDALLRGRQYY